MAKNNKNAIKTAKKQTKTVEEKVKTQAAEAAVEAPKAEETKVEETKVEEPTHAPVEEKKEEIASPNGEVINPEVVEEVKVEKPKPATQVVNTSKAAFTHNTLKTVFFCASRPQIKVVTAMIPIMTRNIGIL